MQTVLDSEGNRVTLKTIGTNGRLHYGKGAVEESDYERGIRERFWLALGKKVRKGAYIK